MRGIRGVTVTALSALVTVALVGLLGSQVPTLPAAAAVTPTWQTTAGYTPLANVSAVSCAPNATASTTTCVAVGDNGGNVASIIVTQNGGTTWSDSTPPSSVTSLSTVSCPSSAVCYAGGDAGIMKSSDGGASWTIQDSSFPPLSISCFSITNAPQSADSGSLAPRMGRLGSLRRRHRTQAF